eukprot:TRINITY_DN5082_c0_g1_i3.p1 TRINITY_DN5082_c0_g1~~TRINITY_DN5082_c0_g1_i3.p1  ORF type:complete len:636 (+),score=150.16 TRINITY_DN5082_c0_g1_i3:51-1958(+)
MDRDSSGFFGGLEAGRCISINPKDRTAAIDEEESWEESTVDEAEIIEEEEEVEDEDAVDENEEDEEFEEFEEEDEEGEEEQQQQPQEKKVQSMIGGAETVTIAEGQEQDHTSWLDLPLCKPLQHAIAQCGWITPTPVQCKAIPMAIEGYDVCCRAVTGSGKTGTFLIPILQRLLTDKPQKVSIRALAVLPTRELAVQCFNMLEQLSQGFNNVRKSLVIGGLSVAAQQRELRNRPEIVVATPGRLIDALRNAQGVTLEGLEILVLDEADRLLSLGFRPQLEELLKHCPTSRQTLLLSATMTREVNELASLSLDKPLNVDVGHVAIASNLTQEFIRLPKDAEDPARLSYICCLCTHEFRKGVIIFCDKKARAERVKALLELLGVKCSELHQNISQTERLEALEKFRTRTVDVLVTTEVAARGLDIAGVRTVINYDLPFDITGYVHRVGRTARIGNIGRAVSFVGEKNLDLMKKVVKLSKSQVGSSATSKIRRRVIEDDRAAVMEKKIKSLSEKLRERVTQKAMERELANAERKLAKQQNTIKFMDEIQARPRATWFTTESDKKSLRKRDKSQIETSGLDDLDDYITGGDLPNAFHAEKKRKQGEPGSKVCVCSSSTCQFVPLNQNTQTARTHGRKSS